jgi:hypothetical protein
MKSVKFKWISIKDSLPKVRVHVLTYSPKLHPIDRYRILETNCGHFFSDVTHWMYLPEPPKGLKEGQI